jgi:hypothetical protein
MGGVTTMTTYRQRTPHFEDDDTGTYSDDARYQVSGYSGVAWRVYGWETEPDEDTEWSGYEVRTGRLVCVMVGDDRRFTFDPEDVSPIDELDYCTECGQIGCTADGRDRSEG